MSEKSKTTTPAPKFKFKKRGNIKKKRQKKYLQRDIRQNWDSIPKDLEDSIILSLTQVLIAEGLRRMKQKKGKKVDREEEDEEEVAERKLKWSYFYCGVNAVTRALERDGVCLVLSDRGVRPEMLTSHLPAMSASKSVPAAVVNLSAVADVLTLQSLACIGITKSENIKHNSIKNLAESIRDKLCQSIKVDPLDESTRPQLSSPHLQAAVTDDSDDEREGNSNTYRLPPEDIPFTSLYIYKDKSSFASQRDYIQLTDVYKESKPTLSQPSKPKSKLLRYMKTSVGQVKMDLNRPEKGKSKKAN